MLSAVATQDTVRLVRHGVRKLLDAVAAADEASEGALASADAEANSGAPSGLDSGLLVVAGGQVFAERCDRGAVT
jgi:hypothetical protein